MATGPRQAAPGVGAIGDAPRVEPGHKALISGRALREVIRYTILVVASATALYPMWWIATVAFKTQAEYVQDPLSLPSSLDFSNFAAVLSNDEILRYFLNSVIVVCAAVPILTATSVAAGYALARLWGRGGFVILFVFLFSELVPIAIVVIPLLLTVKEIGLESGLLRLIFVYSVALMGFGVLVSRSFFRSIPEELREAARLDGCGEFQVFRRIMVPLARSPITLIAVIAFIGLWNEFFLAAVLLDSAQDRTLPLGLTEYRGRYSTDWPKIAAALIISTIPTLILYVLFQGRIANQFSRSTTRD